MKLRSAHAVSSLAVLGLVLAGCQDSYHEKEEHYVLIAANINLPYWQEAAAGLRDVAKEMGLGVKVDIDGPTSYSPKSTHRRRHRQRHSGDLPRLRRAGLQARDVHRHG